MANANGVLPGNRSESMARVSRLYERSYGGAPTGAVADLLGTVEESDPGFSRRVCAVLDSEAAVHDLTLRDVMAHIRLRHLDGRAVECGAGGLDGRMRRMAGAMSEEWGLCTRCIRTAAAWWIDMTIERDLVPGVLSLPAPKAGSGQLQASPAEREPARRGLAGPVRAARLYYEEFNHGSEMEWEELHDIVPDLLDTLKERYPGLRERIADALAAGDHGEAALSLTLNDVIAHNKMWHLIGLTKDDCLDSSLLWGGIARMAEAASKQCGVCVSCGRAAIAGWIARTMAWDLGPRTTPDPLVVPKGSLGAASGGEAAS